MPKDLRFGSLNAAQVGIRLSLPVFAILIVALYGGMFYLEQSYPRIAPYHPRKLVYICFPREDSHVTAYMSFIRSCDIVLCSCLLIPCIMIGVSTSYPRLHWPIALICVLRFIIVMIEVAHLTSHNKDTQLDFIRSVNEGLCKVKEDQQSAFNALVALFTLRSIKGFLTINMATVAYGNSLIICLFGIKPEPEPEVRRHYEIEEEEHELEVLPTRQMTVQFQ